MADNSSLTFLQFFLPVFFFLSPSHLLSLLLPAHFYYASSHVLKAC
uniref:Conotoxin Superfamily SF1 n=1 Tax=Conus episcopatus TaxID=88764 RepID=A0A0K2S715_CONEP|nr:Conotoxin Superfamily SF1 [Conus episcopatus]